jgi:hypothetical protein
MQLEADPGLTVTIYTAEPGSASEDAMRLLASWAASEPTTSATSATSATREEHR